MKTILLTTITLVLLALCTTGIQAQSSQAKLNQVELMKQFIGNWRCEYSKDTSFTYEMKSFGNLGMEWYAKIFVKGNTTDEERSLWGYNKQRDKYIGARLLKSTSIRHRGLLFTSAKICEYLRFDLSNPEKVTSKDIIEFKSPDNILWTQMINNKPGIIYTLTRVKQ